MVGILLIVSNSFNLITTFGLNKTAFGMVIIAVVLIAILIFIIAHWPFKEIKHRMKLIGMVFVSDIAIVFHVVNNKC
jgi:hypothetical protein